MISPDLEVTSGVCWIFVPAALSVQEQCAIETPPDILMPCAQQEIPNRPRSESLLLRLNEFGPDGIDHCIPEICRLQVVRQQVRFHIQQPGNRKV